MTKLWNQLPDYLNQDNNKTASLYDVQKSWLLDCVKRNSKTKYGQKYQFESISNIEQYQKQVPVVQYENLVSYINQIEKGEENILFSGKAIAFEKTSGSSTQKLIPYSSQSLLDFRAALLPWLADVSKLYSIDSGYAYWAISPATREQQITSSGIPVGLPDAAYLGEDLVPFFLESSVVPPWVANISSISDWQLATLYYLVCCNKLRVISVWSPTFFLQLLEALDDRKDELLKLLVSGGDIRGNWLDEDQTAYKRFMTYCTSHDTANLWPDLRLISCWADASSEPYYKKLKTRFKSVPVQAKGLLLTEGVVSIPDCHGRNLLATSSGFYEFRTEDGEIKLSHELTANNSYEVILTTSGGLYRYATGDKVLCLDFCCDKPLLKFTGRKMSSDIVGEKLSEDFVNTCMSGIEGFRMLLPVRGDKPGYLLVVEEDVNIESISELVEQRLLNSYQYAYARKLGQLEPVKAIRIKDAMSIYINSSVHANTMLGDIKIPSLCTHQNIFDNYIGVAA